jgi:hypothetical protein
MPFGTEGAIDHSLSIWRCGRKSTVVGPFGQLAKSRSVRVDDRNLKRESPFNRTVMVTHANGSSGYLPDDAAYDQVSYEIVTTRVKRGGAEHAIVNGFLEMMSPFF